MLSDALLQSAFWQHLETVQRRAGVEKQQFSIVIKPDFSAYASDAASATDPELVECLIDLLYQRGYQQCIVGQSCDSSSLWLENRDVVVLADLLGYHFVTPQDHPYDIVNLAEETVIGDFPQGSVLQGAALSRLWAEADFRISFAKNKTHSSHYYSLCLDGLIDIMPDRDKLLHYRDRIKPWNTICEIQRHYAADFCLIDASTSNHGILGGQLSNPISTNTIIAGQNTLLVDYVAATKMNLDPHCSPVYDFVQREMPLPDPHYVYGDLTPYHGWINVDTLMADASQKRQQYGALDRLLLPWLQQVDSELFPFKDPLNAQFNQFLQKLLLRAQQEPGAYWLLIALNYLIGWLGEGIEAMQVLFWKDHLQRHEVPLNIHPDDYTTDEFASIEPYLDDLSPQLDSSERDENGLRWCFMNDDSVLFDFVQTLPIDFDGFVSSVDISKAIQMMNDYIGGLIVVVDNDEQQRPTHQVERNLYLPQPNYLALYQGKYIDVSKLENIRYNKDQHFMCWKTVFSENDSADYDDGYVSFTRNKDNETQVCVFGRQKFALPPLLEFVNSEAYRPIKKILTKHAYTTFFSTTMCNFAAVYEGRDIRIGKPWLPQHQDPDQAYDSASQLVMGLADKLKELLQIEDLAQLTTTSAAPLSETRTDYIDDEGFAHFTATQAQTEGVIHRGKDGVMQSLFRQAQEASLNYYRDLGKAVSKDLQQ